MSSTCDVKQQTITRDNHCGNNLKGELQRSDRLDDVVCLCVAQNVPRKEGGSKRVEHDEVSPLGCKNLVARSERATRDRTTRRSFE